MVSKTLTIQPLTPERWNDLEDLFGPKRGASSGCWCMWQRISRADWNAMGREGRKDSFQAIVAAGPPPGLLAYEGDQAIAWVAVGPRRTVARFNTMKNSAPTPEGPEPEQTFALTCFYVRNGFRRQGLTAVMAEAALRFAREQGAEVVEVCAIEADRPLIWGDGFVGIASVFRKLGFEEVARRAPRRPLMRKMLRA